MEILINENINKRLDVFLLDYFDCSRNQIVSLIENNFIFVNKKNQKPSYKLKQNDFVEYEEEKISDFLNKPKKLLPYEFELDIKYEDDYIVVLNKPKELLTHITKFENQKTLANILLYHCKNLANMDSSRPGIVHRLDKNTSGLMIAVKKDEVFEDIKNQIKDKTLIRKYKAIALGNFEEKQGTINKPLVHYIKDTVKMTVSDKGLEAVTNYKILEEFKGATLVELELKTGRTHQIRAHLSSINHPIFGDSLYGAKSFMINEFYNLKTIEQLLQSYYISFVHPKTKERMEFSLSEDEFSKDFIKVLNFLRSKNL